VFVQSLNFDWTESRSLRRGGGKWYSATSALLKQRLTFTLRKPQPQSRKSSTTEASLLALLTSIILCS
jgi:hypothetical protein